MKQAHATAATVQAPLLVLQGAQDRVSDPLAVQRWAESTGSTDKSFRLFPDHVHELFQEADWEETATVVADWLDLRIPRG